MKLSQCLKPKKLPVNARGGKSELGLGLGLGLGLAGL